MGESGPWHSRLFLVFEGRELNASGPGRLIADEMCERRDQCVAESGQYYQDYE